MASVNEVESPLSARCSLRPSTCLPNNEPRFSGTPLRDIYERKRGGYRRGSLSPSDTTHRDWAFKREGKNERSGAKAFGQRPLASFIAKSIPEEGLPSTVSQTCQKLLVHASSPRVSRHPPFLSPDALPLTRASVLPRHETR